MGVKYYHSVHRIYGWRGQMLWTKFHIMNSVCVTQHSCMRTQNTTFRVIIQDDAFLISLLNVTGLVQMGDSMDFKLS